MARYIFHTNLGVDECRKRFEASVDRGLPWKWEYHPYWEFVGNVRGNRFQLQRRLSFESGRRQHGLGFQRDTRRMFFGSFVEQQNGIMINLEFRHPRHLQVGLGVGMARFGIVGGVTWLVGILALFGIGAPEVSAPEGFFI